MNRICLFLDKDQPGYSESFINSHIENLNALPINIFKYFPQNTTTPSENLKYPIFKFAKRIIQHFKKLQLKKILKKNKIKIALAEYGMVGAIASKICREMKISLTVHFHGYDAYRKDIIGVYKTEYQDMFDYAKKIIVVSRSMKQQLIELGCPENKIQLNIYGVSDAFFKVSPSFRNKGVFLAVGRFTAKKAPYLTILAFNMVLDTFPDSKLVMIGTGELFDLCRRLIKSLRIERSVELLGALDHNQITDYLTSSVAFVQHSVTTESGDSEGTPVSILEAGAAGIPVISTIHAGIPDVVIHGITGYLVAEDDIFAMRDYMLLILKHPDEAMKMGMSAKSHISKYYSMEVSINGLKKILEIA